MLRTIPVLREPSSDEAEPRAPGCRANAQPFTVSLALDTGELQPNADHVLSQVTDLPVLGVKWA